MSLIKNSLWNLAGYAIPSLIAVPALGLLARHLGVERFGIFTLALAIVGYASIFDAGLTRAVVREIAIYKKDKNEINNIISSSSVCVAILGIIGAATIILCSDTIVLMLKVSTQYYSEVHLSIKILGLTLPFFLLTQVWCSILEGYERFGTLNIQKSVSSSLLMGLPALFVILLHSSLVYAIVGLLVGRLCSLIIIFYVCRGSIISAGWRVKKKTLLRMIGFGGWITVSNIISPVMAYFDRFVLSYFLGAGTVALYTVPSEAISRLTIFPGALARTVFPRLSQADSFDFYYHIYTRSQRIMLVLCLPIVLVGVFFSTPILTLWMGAEYAGEPSVILNILLVGFLFNSLAQIPFCSIQAFGKAKVTALIHLLEVVPYFLLFYFLMINYSFVGAAIAWSVRMFFDYLVLMCSNKYLMKKRNGHMTFK